MIPSSKVQTQRLWFPEKMGKNFCPFTSNGKTVASSKLSSILQKLFFARNKLVRFTSKKIL